MYEALSVNTASDDVSKELTFSDPIVSSTIWSIMSSRLEFRGSQLMLLYPYSAFFVDRSPKVIVELGPK